MTISYDPSIEALFSPGKRACVFAGGAAPDLRAIAVECSRLAYISAESGTPELQRLSNALQRVGFSPPACFSDVDTGAFGYGSLRGGDGLALIAFRGTEPRDPRDLMTDLRLLPSPWGDGHVHRGFGDAAQSLEVPVRDWLDRHASKRKQLLLCGHSLGAAIATLFASITGSGTVITIGSPRVGDADFVKSLPAQSITRVVNCSDVVTTLPPEIPIYRHAGRLLYIDRHGSLHDNPDDAFVMSDRLIAQGDYALRSLADPSPDHLHARPLADHSPINYVRAFF